ncbi:unnamed protein product [Adineta ricciae]|uniref:LamG-like jellyroll fold domain-containing protein n=1 Tax=Adineta ricciae TaxID=249248 RepID=A0A816BQN0_ADIRI|nr:unnamed protein product [Adineta ricciae]
MQSTSVVGFNCFESLLTASRTCEFFYNITSTHQIVPNNDGQFYFIQFPPTISQTMTTETLSTQRIQTTEPIQQAVQAFWPFDNSAKDLYGNYNSLGMNSVEYSNLSITGHGSSLLCSSDRAVNMNSPLNIVNSSFTFELWINIKSYTSSWWLGIMGQCWSQKENQCLHIATRNKVSYFGFFNNDCSGTTQLKVATWYHLSFVYDAVNNLQLIYLNGVLECMRSSVDPLLITSPIPPLTIGMITLYANFYFNGMLDQISFVNRAKSEREILRDATLIAQYSFDYNSSLDFGPNKINGSTLNVSFITDGRVNDALFFAQNNNGSYFLARDLVLLGVPNKPFSISMWLRPSSSNNTGIIVYLDTQSASNWCMPILGFTVSGQLIAQNTQAGRTINVTGPTLPVGVWTHVVYVYSIARRLLLYVNGTYISATVVFSRNTPNSPINLYIGNCPLGNQCHCSVGSIAPKQYYGAIDEFQVYSRELSVNDIENLSNLSNI